MNHKKFRTKKKQKGGSDTDRIEPQDLNNLTDHVNKRMSFLPQQDNLVQFNDINITVRALYRKYKIVRKMNLESSGSTTNPWIPTPATIAVNKYDKELNAHLCNPEASVFTTINKDVNIFKDDGKTEPNEFFADNCYISFNNFHGQHDIPNDFKIVPNNTLICFITGLDYLTITHGAFDTHSINYALRLMNYQTFSEMFKYQINFPESLKKKYVETEPGVYTDFGYLKYENYLYTNCFENSMWYYPGQIYPNLSLSISDKEKMKRGFSYYFFNSANDACPIPLTDKKFKSPEYYKNIYFEGKPPETKVKFKLSDVAEYNKPGLKQKLKLVIVSACRPIMNQNKASMFRLEVLTYHMNKKMITHTKNYVDNIYFNTRCSQQSAQEYAYQYQDPNYTYDNFPLRNDNYHYRIPFLQEAFTRLIQVKENPDKLTQPNPFNEYDLKNIANLTFVKISKFLSLVAEEFKNPNTFKKLVKQLVKNNYQLLNYQFLKYTNLFQYAKHMYINLDGYDHIIEKLEIMKNMAELFQNYGSYPLPYILKFDEFYKKHMIFHQEVGNYSIDYVNEQHTQHLSVINQNNPDVKKLVTTGDYFGIDVENSNLLSIKFSYLEKFLFKGPEPPASPASPPASPPTPPDETAEENFKNGINRLLKFVPNLKEFMLYRPNKSVNEFLITELSTSLTYLELVDTKFNKLDIRNLVNLTDLIFYNNTEIESLNLSKNQNLKRIELHDLNKLLKLKIGSKRQEIDLLEITSVFHNYGRTEIYIYGKIHNMVLKDCRLENLNVYNSKINYFRLANLTLTNTNIKLEILKKLCLSPFKRMSMFAKLISYLKLDNSSIMIDTSGYEKENILEFLPKFKNIELYHVYYKTQNTSPQTQYIYQKKLIVLNEDDLRTFKFGPKRSLRIDQDMLGPNVSDEIRGKIEIIE